MRKQINFFVSDNNQLTKKIIDYFAQFGFKLIEQNNEHIKFKQDSSLFDAWKANPLKWGSEVTVFIKGDNIVTDFDIDSEAQLNTLEEEIVWNTFIENFQNYMSNGNVLNDKINSAIIENRKKRIRYIIWAILGAFAGVLINFIYNKLTNSNSIICLFLIPIMATTFLAWKINYRKTKIAL